MAIQVKSRLNLLGIWFPLFLIVWLAGLAVIVSVEEWYVLIGVAAFGLIVIVAAIRPVPLVHVGLVLRLGRRVLLSEEVTYYRQDPDGTKIELTAEEVSASGFNPETTEIEKEVKKIYLIKSEGLRIVFPLVEKLVVFSLAIQEEEVDATDVYTKDRVLIKPKVFAVWRVIDVGLAVEIEGGEAKLKEAVNDAIKVAMRDTFSSCTIEEALARVKKPDPQNPEEKHGPLGKLLEKEIGQVVGRWGVRIQTLRVSDVKQTDDSKDVFDALEAVKKAALKREAELIDADRQYGVRAKLAEAGLIEKQREAEGRKATADAEAFFLKQQIAAFVGKVPEEITRDDAVAYATFQVAQQAAKSLDNNSTVILPSGDLGKLVGQFMGLFGTTKGTTRKTQ